MHAVNYYCLKIVVSFFFFFKLPLCLIVDVIMCLVVMQYVFCKLIFKLIDNT